MIKLIDSTTFSDHFEGFCQAARSFLPVLGYSDEKTEAFIQGNSDLYEDIVFEIVCSGGSVAYARRERWKVLVYLLPSSWEDRYQIIREALPEITGWYNARPEEQQDEELRCDISEAYPSLSAYYGGMLPDFGFDLQPRVSFRADRSLVERTVTPALPKVAAEKNFREFDLDDYVRVSQEANSGYKKAHLPKQTEEQKHRKCREFFANAQTYDDVLKTWVAVSVQGKLVGYCFGACRWGDLMSIEDLAVLPAYWGQGIGKYLLVRCMQQLDIHFAAPSRYFELETYRNWARPLQLYRRLGFTPNRAWLEAKYVLGKQLTQCAMRLRVRPFWQL